MSDDKKFIANQESPAAGLQSLFKMLRILFFCFLTLIIAVFVYFLFSGIFRVDEQNEAMLFRFGRLQEYSTDYGTSAILQSGKWYWAWPYPIDEIIMIPSRKATSVSTGSTFLPWINPAGVKQGQQEMNRPMQTGIDGYLLSGDNHIFHTEWQVTYSVSDPQNYYLNFYDDSALSEKDKANPALQRGHEAILRCLLSDAVLLETATWSTEDLLSATRGSGEEFGHLEEEHGHEDEDEHGHHHHHDHGESDSSSIEECIKSRLAKSVEEVGLGINILSVTLTKKYEPAAATIQAFNYVNICEGQKNIAIQNARSYANSLLLAAESNRDRIIGEANAYKDTIVKRLAGDASYFEDIISEYEKNPYTTATYLYLDAVQQVLGKVPNKYLLHSTDGKQQLRLQIGPTPEKPQEPPTLEPENGAGPQ